MSRPIHRPRRSNAPPRTPTPPPVAPVAPKVDAPDPDEEARTALPLPPLVPAIGDAAQHGRSEGEGEAASEAENEADRAKPDADGAGFDLFEPEEGAADRARRARGGKYVKAALAICAALGVAVFLRGTLASRRDAEALRARSSTTDNKPAPPLAQEVPTGEPPLAPALDFDAALAGTPEGAKRDALIALEARRVPEAIAAGKRATAFDPHDGEAWLILGAAYQEGGQLGEARRCYRACVVQGRNDPRGECAAMIR